jgi:hypothetical protein
MSRRPAHRTQPGLASALGSWLSSNCHSGLLRTASVNRTHECGHIENAAHCLTFAPGHWPCTLSLAAILGRQIGLGITSDTLRLFRANANEREAFC